MARVRGAPARHRRAHQLRAAPQALVLPDQERRPARLRARRDRDDRAGRALSPAGDAEARATRASRDLPRKRRRDRPHARGDPAARRKPRSQPRADRSPASSCTIAATTRCCSCGRRATPSSSSGRPTRHAAPFERLHRQAAPRRSEQDTAYVEQPDATARVPGQAVRRRGIDGSGKTTQLALLAKWLSAEGHRVFVTEWNSSALVKAATKTGQEEERADADDVQPAARHRLR